MKTNLVVVVCGLAACALFSSVSIAQDVQEVTVQATRILNKKTVGHTSSGIQIIDVSVAYGVSAADLDLASHVGALALEKRVRDAAMRACKEITRQYPDATPADAECAKAAEDKAMVRVRELEAAAAKKSGT